MPESCPSITVRRLPDGGCRPAQLEEIKARQLLISGLDHAEAREFSPGALVEIQSENEIYFGQVLGPRESFLLIGVEHSLNRVALAEIGRVWSGRQSA